MEILDEKEVAAFLAMAKKKTRLYAAFVIAIRRGLRRGEVLALRWSDVDLEEGLLTVNQNLTYVPGEGLIFGTPKSEMGNRTVPIDDEIITALREQLVRVEKERAKYDHKSDLIFPTRYGKPTYPDNFGRAFNMVCDYAEITGVRLHDLRHTFITQCIDADIPLLIVQVMAGHSDIKQTRKYTHVGINMLRTHLKKLNKNASSSTVAE